MEDLLFDRFGKHLPFLFYSGRVDALKIVVASSILWILFGWDGTIDQLAGGRYGVGIHISTIQTIAFFFYLLMVNLQAGGIKSFRQFYSEVARDFSANFEELRVVKALVEGRKAEAKARYNIIREPYRFYTSIDPLRAVSFSILIVACATCAFECVWVPLYDWFQFGSVMWPIYLYTSQFWSLTLRQFLLYRNNLGAIAAVVIALWVVYWAWDGEGENLTRRFRVSWRFDRWALLLATICCASWIAWIYAPHSIIPLSSLNPSAILCSHPVNSTFLNSQSWAYPKQVLFPQTELTFYPASVKGTVYTIKSIFGFYVSNNLVHLINLITKYLMYLLVCYPAMITINKAKPVEGRRE